MRGRVRWGTIALWVVTIFGFAYLYIPLITIALFSFNAARGPLQHELEQLHVGQLGQRLRIV